MKFHFEENDSIKIKFVYESDCENNIFCSGEKNSIFPDLSENIIYVGLGKKDSFSKEVLRKASYELGRFISCKDIKNISIDLKEDFNNNDYAIEVVEGLLLSSYTFDYYKSEKSKFNLENVYFLKNINLEKEIKELENNLKGQFIARDLVNKRSNDIYPESLANIANETLSPLGVKVSVYDEQEIEKMGLEAFLAVGKGSDKAPRFIVMEYFNGGDKKPLVYVGKGLTYDSGGYSIKPSDGMKYMNSDMGGSATVIGAMYAIAKNKLNVNIVAIVAACENLISGKAYKPGDVISSLSKKTIEVDNTDAEGRLTLADAVFYGSTNYDPEIIIDLATLTGACLVALGERYSGIITNSKEALEKLQKAADEANEKIWELPNDPAFKELNKSEIADIKNSGGRFGGTITAGQFVGEFVKEGVKWIHMDIAGTAYLSKKFDCYDAGATGIHVKTLYNLAKNYSSEKIVMTKITKAIIPAAGFGTRFLPATKSLPKEMLSIIDKPTLQFVVEEAVEAGISDILIILSRNKESIINHFDSNIELESHLRKQNKTDEINELKKLENMANIYYMRQDQPKGLGHAISLGKTFAGSDPVAVLLGDDVVINDYPALKQLIDCFEKYNSTILGVQEVADNFVHKYGIIDGNKCEDSIYKVGSLVEKPNLEEAPSNVAILGRYILTPKIFEILENQKPGINNEIQLTDALLKLTEYENIYAKIFQGKRHDLGSKIGFIKATIDRALELDEFRNDTLEYMEEVIKKYK